MNNYSYTGKKIYVGIDVHKKSYSITAICDKAVIKRDTLVANTGNLVYYLHKHFSGAKIFSAYEAGFSGFNLHRTLISHGVQNIVVNAASVEVGARDRVKTDRRDSLKIATQLSAHRLKGIYVPDKEMEDRRELTRLRRTLVKDRNRIGVRMKHKANFHGLIGPEDNEKVSNKWIEKVKKMEMMSGLKTHFDSLIRQWYFLNDEIKEIENQLNKQAEDDPELEMLYMSCPGIGKTSARMLANELGDMHQFRSNKTLYSYVGLTPCEYSSGEHVRKGHITRQGKPDLRGVLVQCSWRAIKCDSSLREIFDRIAARQGKKRAIVAVARRLVGRLRSCSMKGELYQCDYGIVTDEAA